MGDTQNDWPKLMLRLPADCKTWLAEQSRKNASSQNSEIVRCIRERMEKGVAAPTASAPSN
jgi:hypothetical protein